MYVIFNSICILNFLVRTHTHAQQKNRKTLCLIWFGGFSVCQSPWTICLMFWTYAEHRDNYICHIDTQELDASLQASLSPPSHTHVLLYTNNKFSNNKNYASTANSLTYFDSSNNNTKKRKKMKICFRNRKSLSLSINMCVRYSAYVYLCFCRIEFQIERWTVEMLNRCSQRCVCKVDRYMKGEFDFIKARELQRSSSASLSLKHEARAVMTTLKTFPFGESKREMLHTTVKESGNRAVGTTNNKQQRKKTKEKFFSFLALQTIFIESTWASDAVYIKWLPDSICLHKN